MIIGVDEVGRGCIAGDLVVCAFALRPDLTESEVDQLRSVAMDSKAFKNKKRREQATQVAQKFGVYELRRADPRKIDEMNIRGATLWAMAEAARALDERLCGVREVLFDGKDCPEGFDVRGRAVIKGDASVLEISAASMIAKTIRDAEMVGMAKKFPGYGFEKHAGYGTVAHREAIASLGLSPVHRSWARKFLRS